MSLADPIADMLTRIRNASKAGLDTVEMFHSKIKGEVARVMKKEGFVLDYVVEGGSKRKVLRVYLKYIGEDREPVIRGLKRVSKSGLRTYVGAKDVPIVMRGMGVVVMTTPLGVMTGKEANRRGVGGEIICMMW